MTIGQRLTEFYEKTNPRQRQRVAGIVNSETHWTAIQTAASSGDDDHARLALRNLRGLFDKRQAESPVTAGMRLFQLGGILGPALADEFMGLLGDAA